MTLDNEVRSLQALPMFRGVDATKLKLLAFASERLSFAENDHFFRQGDPSDAAYVVLSGKVHVVLENDGACLKVADLPRGSVVGEMGILTDNPRSASIIAAEPTEALRIRKDVFFDLIKEFPQIGIAVMRDIAARLDRTNTQLAAMQGR